MNRIQGPLLKRAAESQELLPSFEYRPWFRSFNVWYFIYFSQKCYEAYLILYFISTLQVKKCKFRKDRVK